MAPVYFFKLHGECVHKKSIFIYCIFILIFLLLHIMGCNSRNTRPLQASSEKIEISPQLEDSTIQPQMNLPRTLVTIKTPDKRMITLEAQIASTPEQKAKGLMFRKHMPESEGMLFIYDHEEELGFYMANCFISLDMIFMDRNREVVGIIENAKPMDPTVLSIGRPSQYVLEVNAGFVQRHHITQKTRIFWNEPESQK